MQLDVLSASTVGVLAGMAVLEVLALVIVWEGAPSATPCRPTGTSQPTRSGCQPIGCWVLPARRP